MRHIIANSVNDALYNGLYHLNYHGLDEESRNGTCVVSPMPVMTTYLFPRNRVLINKQRNANPFFHLFEALWMLAGRNDLAFPQKFVSTFEQFSDDGETLHGAYGHRWRNWFGYDQLETIVGELDVRKPRTRRAVLTMWCGGGRSDDTGVWSSDLHTAINGGKDVPCNTHAYFDTIDGKLNMTVCCRSNDVILGAYGANAVHFSILLEYMATRTGRQMGKYRQFSNDFHIYSSSLEKGKFCSYAESVAASDFYTVHKIRGVRELRKMTEINLVPLLSANEEVNAWHDDLHKFISYVYSDDTSDEYTTYFFRYVVLPMWRAWSYWKGKTFDSAMEATYGIRADDWRTAAQEWLTARRERREAKEATE